LTIPEVEVGTTKADVAVDSKVEWAESVGHWATWEAADCLKALQH